MAKFKVLMLCDDPRKTSGVGCQARHLIEGLTKTGKWKFNVLGGAIRHENYDTETVTPDFVVKPVDNFGTPDMIRNILIHDRPDAIFLFTDPRFFTWIWEMEEEIHQVCPIVYWHVWDNDPWPRYNEVLYESTDLLNCHSYLTYEMVHSHYPNKTNFIPHALPRDMFHPIPRDEALRHRDMLIGPDRHDHFVCTWVNRNARRKMPGNVLLAWKEFLDMLQEKHGHRKATLVMHTEPHDPEGQNLPIIAEHFGIKDSVVYSAGRVSFDNMCILYNIGDFTITLSVHEGFGLGTLEAMQCGKPIIAVKTGGLTRQVVDHRDGSENGIALTPEVRDLVGGQMVPYIYEDHVSTKTAAAAIFKMYEMGHEERARLGAKARDYVLSEFDIDKTVSEWDRSMGNVIEKWRSDRRSVYTPWETIAL